jgi:hypothetical protein
MLQRTCCQRRIQGSRFGISRLSKGPWTWGTGGSSLKGDQSNYGLRDRPVASAYCPSIKGAGTRVCGYAIKNSGLTVEVIRQHLHVCVKELRVKIRTSGVARVGLDGRGPYRNKWSRSQGTGWVARRVMTRSMKPQCWNVTTRSRACCQLDPLMALLLGRSGVSL